MHKGGYVNSDVLSIKCILEEDKICDNCCECFVCDLDPGKICDNCAKCLKIPDYKAIIIDDILMLEESRVKKKKKKSGKNPADR
ncbi:hypothetical protein Psch_00408 [Pelotomaculum schinkii]|uniref:Uncharacterized protein n=1 Tax=Pelotomaculum schinkii TaxID=78350 RepID=A0A4Y7RCX3_9FIRM|nr:hypothetical protein [Pelotomaculum schinkii]TEB06875.1 hypothetical protein Psch_00408 [Pelotomaculum schinkii]